MLDEFCWLDLNIANNIKSFNTLTNGFFVIHPVLILLSFSITITVLLKMNKKYLYNIYINNNRNNDNRNKNNQEGKNNRNRNNDNIPSINTDNNMFDIFKKLQTINENGTLNPVEKWIIIATWEFNKINKIVPKSRTNPNFIIKHNIFD